jgi:hypothetical protein
LALLRVSNFSHNQTRTEKALPMAVVDQEFLQPRDRCCCVVATVGTWNL